MTNIVLPHADQYLKTGDLEKYTPYKKRFWEARRISGDSPPFIRISSRAVLYRWGDVVSWLEGRTRKSTSDNGRAN
jgi:hypothetical protein